MRLASLDNGTRDGWLVFVARDLSRMQTVEGLTLQSLLDNWAARAPALTAAYAAFDADDTQGQPYDPTRLLAPLPRAYQWVDGSAYVNHVELVRRARGAEMPESFWHDPLVYQGGSDDFLAPTAPISVADANWGADFEAEVAVITDDVPMGVDAVAARGHIRLIMLVNDVSLRNLIPGELAKGFGFYQSKPASAFSPLAITPDELGDMWRDGKVHGALRTHLNGALFGCPDAGQDMTFDFGQLIAHCARTRRLRAGTIVGSGAVSNKMGTDYGKPVGKGGVGYSCIAELRMVETIEKGAPHTAFLAHGDQIAIDMLDAKGQSLFGTIQQQVVIGHEPHSL